MSEQRHRAEEHSSVASIAPAIDTESKVVIETLQSLDIYPYICPSR